MGQAQGLRAASGGPLTPQVPRDHCPWKLYPLPLLPPTSQKYPSTRHVITSRAYPCFPCVPRRSLFCCTDLHMASEIDSIGEWAEGLLLKLPSCHRQTRAIPSVLVILHASSSHTDAKSGSIGDLWNFSQLAIRGLREQPCVQANTYLREMEGLLKIKT